VSAKERGAAAAAAPCAPDTGPSSALLKLRQACRQVFGIPDYDRYLAHFTRQHPGETPLSRSEFFARSIDRKYGKSGPRCC